MDPKLFKAIGINDTIGSLKKVEEIGNLQVNEKNWKAITGAIRTIANLGQTTERTDLMDMGDQGL